jgi:hypothetical protein
MQSSRRRRPRARLGRTAGGWSVRDPVPRSAAFVEIQRWRRRPRGRSRQAQGPVEEVSEVVSAASPVSTPRCDHTAFVVTVAMTAHQASYRRDNCSARAHGLRSAARAVGRECVWRSAGGRRKGVRGLRSCETDGTGHGRHARSGCAPRARRRCERAAAAASTPPRLRPPPLPSNPESIQNRSRIQHRPTARSPSVPSYRALSHPFSDAARRHDGSRRSRSPFTSFCLLHPNSPCTRGGCRRTRPRPIQRLTGLARPD